MGMGPPVDEDDEIDFGAASLSQNAFFASTGATWPWYSQVGYSAIYVPSTTTTWFAWEAWNGSRLEPMVTTYNHTTEVWTEPVVVATDTLTNDSHGVPALCRDADGYVHCFYGAHGDPQEIATSVAVDDPRTWRDQTELSTNHSYPHPVLAGSAIYLFHRDDTDSDDRRLSVTPTTSITAGVPAWGSRVDVVALGPDARAYPGTCIVDGTDIHVVFTRADAADSIRKHVYYLIYDTVTGDVRNFAGDVTVDVLALPVDLTTANASFRLYTHTGSNGTSIPQLCRDTDGRPHIAFANGLNSHPAPTTADVLHIMHNGSAWTDPATVGTITSTHNGTAVIPKAAGEVEIWWSQDLTGTILNSRGGTMKRKTRSAAGVFGAEGVVRSPGAFALDVPKHVQNGHANARAIYCEITGDETAESGALKMYADGASGPLIRINPSDHTFVNAEAATAVAAMTVPPSRRVKYLYDEFFTLVKAGIGLSKFDAIWLIGTHDAQAGRLNLKNPGTNTLTVLAGAPTFTAFSGYATDGVDDVIDMNFNPATAGGVFTQNSASFGIYTPTVGSQTNSLAGWFDGTDGTRVLHRNASNQIGFRINQAAVSSTAAGSVMNGSGLTAANRSASNATQVYRRGLAVSVSSGANQTSTALNDHNFLIGDTTGATFAAATLSGAFIGGSLTAAEHLALYHAMRFFLRNVGAAD